MNSEEKNSLLASFLITAGSALVTVIVFRLATHPDTMKTVAMKVSKYCEDFSQRNAEAWAHSADICRHAYENARTSV